MKLAHATYASQEGGVMLQGIHTCKLSLFFASFHKLVVRFYKCHVYTVLNMAPSTLINNKLANSLLSRTALSLKVLISGCCSSGNAFLVYLTYFQGCFLAFLRLRNIVATPACKDLAGICVPVGINKPDQWNLRRTRLWDREDPHLSTLLPRSALQGGEIYSDCLVLCSGLTRFRPGTQSWPVGVRDLLCRWHTELIFYDAHVSAALSLSSCLVGRFAERSKSLLGDLLCGSDAAFAALRRWGRLVKSRKWVWSCCVLRVAFRSGGCLMPFQTCTCT